MVVRAAIMRRAVANKGLTRFVQAKHDLEMVLEKEPNNKQALVGILLLMKLSHFQCFSVKSILSMS